MATPQEKAQTVCWFIESNSVTQTQRNFRKHYKKYPPSRNSILEWKSKFLETGSVLSKKNPGRPCTRNEEVERVRESFLHSPRKSLRSAARELDMPVSTVHKVLRKKLRLYAYKVQLVQALEPNDRPKRMQFATDMLRRIENGDGFLRRILFCDEACFHVSGTVNRHNVRIWGSENPHHYLEIARDSPKVNVWCGLMHDRIIGPFFFAEKTVKSVNYLDMLENFVFPQIEGLHPDIILQQDGAPPHWGTTVRHALDECFPGRWIGRGGPLSWPPRSPDITPLDFFLWGYVKDIVYQTKVADIDELKARIRNAVATVDIDMLARTWQEIEHRLDILRATKGAHIEVY